ncbi:MAG: VPLPA-CTERM sorting domain-containing protein [Pseudomonadota bacterium]
MMVLRLPALALVAAALHVSLPTPASAAVIVETGIDDTVFTTRCGGTACEKAVAEGRAGNQAANGDFEAALGVPNTLTTANINAGGGSAQFTGWNAGAAWTLSYTAASNELVFDVTGLPALTTTSADIADAPSIFVRVRGRDDTQSASLSGLTFNGQTLGDGTLSSTGSAAYLAFAGFEPTADWVLAGVAQLVGGRGSAPAFQVKLTDAQVVPVPAALPLLASGILGLAWLRRRRATV